MQLQSEFKKICPIKENLSMKNLTTFKIGGVAKLALFPQNIDQMLKCLNLCKKKNLEFIILVACSNVLVNDKGISKIVIFTTYLDDFSIKKDFVICEAGKRLGILIGVLSDMGLSGLEWGIGIPGSVGGAVYMNAGAFGGQIGDYVEFVDVWEDGEIKHLKKDEIFFNYRCSSFTNQKNCVILKIGLKLNLKTKESCKQLLHKFTLKRMSAQNVGLPSAGSIFKANTPLPPAFMIEKLGLKGLVQGGAGVSKVHSGYIVNISNATSNDVLQLIDLIRQKVFEKFNVQLELEIVII